MGYKEQYEQAKKAGDIKKVSVQYIPWEEKGQSIIGKFLSTNTVGSDENQSGYNQYLFRTDDGPVKFALSRHTDSEVLPLMTEGRVYCVTYQGQEKIKGGRRVNKFDVEEIPTVDDEAVGGAEDMAF